jgi:HK97 family phage major capsid protein
LGWSSGSIAHLTQRANGIIKSWPIVEFSLTPTPAEPRTLGVERIKALAELDPSLKALVPEDGTGKPSEESADKDMEATKQTQTEDKSMSENGQADIAAIVADQLKAYDENKAAAAKAEADRQAEIEKAKAEAVAEFKKTLPADNDPGVGAPAVIKSGLGDTETKSFLAYVRSGQPNDGVKAFKASNDTDMNVGTDADGGYAVPTGHYQGIIARRDEASLISRLGVMPIPGKGTTVNVPFDNEADGEFVSTAEGSDHDRDAPAIGQKALTLARYTKKIQLSWELLEDEDSKLMAFLENFVGRGMAKTHNNLLLTEVASNGTALKTFASATVIAVDELESLVFNDNLTHYLDDAGSVAWVMLPSVHGEIVVLDDANFRRYWQNAVPDGANASLLNYPVMYSNKSGATAASTKSVYFGNWSYVGWRDAGMMNFLRDPYSYEAGIELRYQFRTIYGVLVAEAIGYGVHPSA